jgi:ribonucleoside-diphosphate reductase alpha chain
MQDRFFFLFNQHPYESVKISVNRSLEFVKRTSEIKNPDGSVVFRMEDVLVPAAMVAGSHRYYCPEIFQKSRSTKVIKEVKEKGVPAWLQSSKADGKT